MRDAVPRRWWLPALIACVIVAGAGQAQNTRDTQRRLDSVQRELRNVASERRRLEGQRGAAAQEVRRLDEQVGSSARALEETRGELARQEQRLATLQQQRVELRETMGTQRAELARLLRAAYATGGAAPLKLALSQDSVAEATRLLTLQRYLQRQRSERIGELRQELVGLDRVEAEILRTRTDLQAAQARQQQQVAKLERDRAERKASVGTLEQRYRDRRAREQALGRDARSLESLLRQLRAAAARAEAERRAAAARAEAERQRAQRAAAATTSSGAAPPAAPAPPPRPAVAMAAPIRVGGLGWPVDGTLLARFGGTMPDGRRSSGLLIAAPAGTPVRAVADGQVVFAEWMAGYGLICIVDHGGGTLSLYAHNDSLLRDVGASVKRGDAVASVGTSGGHGRPALYFELRRAGKPVDPSGFLQRQ